VSVFAPEIPALPRGYTGVPRELVAASQRQRLLHGVTVAVAAKGYGATTITDIAARAGVSKKTFYEHFAGKADCFLASYDHGREALLAATNDAAVAAADAGAGPIDQLRAGNRAYLAFLVAEEHYARTFFLEVLAAGPEAVARYQDCRMSFAAGLRAWHTHARAQRPSWPAAPDVAYEAATGATHDLTMRRIAAGRTATLPVLEDDLLLVQLSLLRVPRPRRG
jgi:AcrR family transcriptional regulator